MADDQVKVSIIADAEGVAPGVNAAKENLGGLGDSAKAATAQMRESFDGVSNSARAMGSAVREATSNVVQLRPAMAGAHSGMSGVTRELIVMGRELGRGNFSRLAGSATILAQRLYFMAPALVMTTGLVALLASPIIAVAAAFVQGSNEAAKFQNSMEATNGYAGVTISQLQNMSRALATTSNVSIGTATGAMMKLAASGKFSGETLQLVGQDAVRMGQLTGEGADKFIEEFSKMGRDVAKFAQEYQDNYHQLTVAQYEHIAKLQEEGRTEEAQHEMAKAVYDYLGKQAPEQLGYLARAWRGVGEAISSAWDSLKAWGRNSNQDQIDDLNQRIALMKKDPNANKGGEVTREIQSLEQQVAKLGDVEKAQQKVAQKAGENARVQTEGVDAAAKLHQQFENSRSSGEKLKIKLQEINQELAKAVAANPQNKALYEQEAEAARKQAMISDAPKKPKAEKSRVSEWQEKLEAEKVAFDMSQAAQNAHDEWSLERDVKYWKDLLDQTSMSSKEMLSVQEKYLSARKDLKAQELQGVQDTARKQLDAARQDTAQRILILRTEAEQVSQIYGAKSRQYLEVERQLVEETRKASNEVRQIEDQNAKAGIKAAQDKLDADETLAKFRVEMGLETNRQLLADEKKFETERFNTQMQDLAREFVAAKGNAAQQNAILIQQEEAYRQHEQKLTQIDQQAVLQRTQIERTAIASVSTAFGSDLAKMLTLQKSFAATMSSIYMSMVNAISGALAKMIEQWIQKQLAALLLSKTATATTATANVAAQTAAYTAMGAVTIPVLSSMAGAAGVASMAAAPFPLDTTAPEFGATMKSAAMAFSAAGGWGQVPYDDAPTLLHRNEMVLPASLATPLRTMLTGNANDNGGSHLPGAGGGDTHVHIHATDSESVKKLFSSEEGMAGLKHALRKAGAGLKY
jgi:phage-related minor tail protein